MSIPIEGECRNTRPLPEPSGRPENGPLEKRFQESFDTKRPKGRFSQRILAPLSILALAFGGSLNAIRLFVRVGCTLFAKCGIQNLWPIGHSPVQAFLGFFPFVCIGMQD